MQRRKQPMRLCLGCGERRPKRELVRVVRSPAGEIQLDPTGKANGRGAYICPDPACLEKALKGQRLAHALECALPPETVDALSARLAAQP
jgi:hypothetical protein